MQERYDVALPLRVPTNKAGTKHFILNLNQYRNAHHFTKNAAKVEFKRLMGPEIRKLPIFERVELIYTIFPRTRLEFDVGNPGSILDKFFSDALVELGHLPDDNYKHIPQVTYRFGAVDPVCPRAVVTIVPLEIKDQPVKIILSLTELREAIEQYVADNINLPEGSTAQIGAITGTKPEDLEVIVQIVRETDPPFDVQTTTAQPAGTRQVRKPRQSKAEKVAAGQGAPVEQPQVKPAATAPVQNQATQAPAQTPAPAAQQQPVAQAPAPASQPAPQVAAGESLFGGAPSSAPATASQIGGAATAPQPEAGASIFGNPVADGAAAATGTAENAAVGEPAAGQSLFGNLVTPVNG